MSDGNFTISFSCSCGATMTIENWQPEIAGLFEFWQRNHQHVSRKVPPWRKFLSRLAKKSS